MKQSLSPLSIPVLRAELSGRVIAPEDPEYDQARTIFMGGFDRRPAAIVRPVHASDVAHAIGLVRESGLSLAIRSGGHSGVGHSTTDGGVVLDLHDMKSLEIDVDGHRAWAETGLTAGEYTTAVGAHGLATGFGDTGSVGIGGITLAGGIGRAPGVKSGRREQRRIGHGFQHERLIERQAERHAQRLGGHRCCGRLRADAGVESIDLDVESTCRDADPRARRVCIGAQQNVERVQTAAGKWALAMYAETHHSGACRRRRVSQFCD